jgi:hypothetical protein
MSLETDGRIDDNEASGDASGWKRREIDLSVRGLAWVAEDVGRRRASDLIGHTGRYVLHGMNQPTNQASSGYRLD